MQLDPDAVRARIATLFQENFDKFGELGAAVSVWQNGKPIVDLHGGFTDARRDHPWTHETLVLIWSATKGLGSACALHALQENKIDIDRRVSEIWPEFAQAGKGSITLAQLLSHQAGLCALDRSVDVLDYPAVIDALEKQKPLWPPGTALGYHARTFGFLLDELVRRIAGIPFSSTGAKYLPSHSSSISGSAYRKKKMRALRRFTRPKRGSCPSRNSSMSISPPPELSPVKHSPRPMVCIP